MLNLAQCGGYTDGGTDSHARIQAALDNLSDNDEVYIPAKATFLVSDTLTIQGLERIKIWGPGTITPSNAVVNKPVLELINNRHSTLEGFSILGNAGNAPAAGVRFHRVTGGFAPSHMKIVDLHIGSTAEGSIVDGVDFTAADDSNNAESEIYRTHIQNFSGAAVHYEHSNSLLNRIFGGLFESYGASGVNSVGVKASGAGSFQVFGTDLLVQDWDFYIDGAIEHAFEVFGVHAEGTAKILYVDATSSKPKVRFFGYTNKPGLASAVNIDVNTEADCAFMGCHLNEGAASVTYDFDGGGSQYFGGCRLGVATIEHEGHLAMVGNKGTAGGVTFTEGVNATRELFGNVGLSSGDHALNLFEQPSDIGPPATDSVVIYAKNNGGKTELVARFPTGAIQQLAIEP